MNWDVKELITSVEKLDGALDRWRMRRAGELGSFADASDLVAFLRDSDAAPAPRKDSAFAAICAGRNIRWGALKAELRRGGRYHVETY